jgi:hypothetical protein
MRARMVVRWGINFRFGGGTFQSLSGQPVHRRGVHWRADQKRDRRQHGAETKQSAQTVLAKSESVDDFAA